MTDNNGSRGAAAKLLTSIVNGNDINGVNTQVLLFLKALHDANAGPIDPETVEGDPEDRSVFFRVVDMLRGGEFIAGPSDRVLLTTKGITTIKTASSDDYRVAQFFRYGRSVLTQHNPTELVITILRAHFEEWQDR